jgi:hypothetical protein
MPRAEPVTIAVRGPSVETAYLLVWKDEMAGTVRGSRRGAFVVRWRKTEAIVVGDQYKLNNNETAEL